MRNFTENKTLMNGLIVDAEASSTYGVEVQATQSVEAQPEVPLEAQVVETQVAGTNGLIIPKDSPESAGTQVTVATANHNALATQTDNAVMFKAGGEDVDESELGYGAFKKLKIESGEFDLDGTAAGKRMWVAVQNRRVQRLIKPKGVTDPTDEQMAYYSLIPGVNPNDLKTTKGVSVAEFKQSLKEDGLTAEEVEYEMVGAKILKPAKEVGDVVPAGTLIEMQIPQASMQRFRGLMVTAQKAGIPMQQRVLQVMVGPKTQGKGGSYNPWVIDSVQGTADSICEKLGIDLVNVSGISVDDADF